MSPAERQASLQAISSCARKTCNIINELLVLAGVRRTDAHVEPLHMAGVLDEAQEQLESLIEEYRAEIVKPDTSIWPVALGYAPWVEEVWINYLSNAIKYGGRPPRIEVGGAPVANGMVRFWVRDNGDGLTPEDRDCLFTPFTRLARIRAKGHGLGLSIARRIVEKLGGEVGVESQGVPGQGSLFFFTLPGAEELG
jgi:signal transduction histidine kinase